MSLPGHGAGAPGLQSGEESTQRCNFDDFASGKTNHCQYRRIDKSGLDIYDLANLLSIRIDAGPNCGTR